jgi:electron transfer flavoprotein alpha subunit
MTTTWLVVTDPLDLCTLGRLVPGLPVDSIVIGDRALADSSARTGVRSVHWIEPVEGVPADAYAAAAADIVLGAAPGLVATTATAPASRAVVGVVAARRRASVLSGVTSVSEAGDAMEVAGGAAGNAVVATWEVSGPLCAFIAPADEPPAPGVAIGLTPHPDAAPRPSRVTVSAAAVASGLADAARVVGVGRGLRSRADLAMVEALAGSLDAELACSMPLAEDLGWLPKDRFVGRSGQQVSPRLYLAIGLSGAPQHLQGVRGAKVIVAVNSDPEAAIFRAADYGIVGDLYEVVPALTAVLASD